VIGLDEWIDTEAHFAATAMVRAISATHLVMDRPGFGQLVIPRLGSVLASPVCAHYDPDPDYFFHWFRDSAIVVDALRVALAEGLTDNSAIIRFREFVEFSLSLHSLNGSEFLRHGKFRERIQPLLLQYVRPDAEIAAVSGEGVLSEARVNADGTLDFTRWSRPQADGPALRSIALTRWWRQFPDLAATLRAAMQELIVGDLAFTLAQTQKTSFDIWEEESGYHYYTQLVQAEALAQGAKWLTDVAKDSRSNVYGAAADEVLARLDDLWSDANGFYRSRTGTGSGETGKDLDIAVILSVLHAGRMTDTHSVVDPKTQATLTALEQLFEAEYAINSSRSANYGPAMGRYADDAYYSGGAYFFATLAAAEFYFRLAKALQLGAKMPITKENEQFRRRLGAADAADQHHWITAAVQRGDAIMRTVQAFTPVGGDLSEQFDRTTGEETSAKHLTWSYAAFITAVASRTQVYLPIPGSGIVTKPAGMV
jgi:glucoamylase